MKWLNSFARVAAVQALCPETLLVRMGDPEPIEWMLLTTVPVHTFDHAVERAEGTPRAGGSRSSTAP
jgi:hypothetical protein